MAELDKLAEWKRMRQACRTNLFYLCRVLGYKDVNMAVHGKMIANLQQFKGGEDTVGERQMAGLKPDSAAINSVKAIREGYKPFVPDFWSLTGQRKRANFIPRGHLKTTVCTFAHTIQWIINYPNFRMLISTHTDGKGKEFVSEIRNHFIKNEHFRFLFPEHVPQGKAISDFGNQEWFDTCSRTVWRKEHTVSFSTLNSAMAGGHFDGIKHDDLVDSENVKTTDQITSVKKHVADMVPLLETHAHETLGEMSGWEDLVGTFYDYSDLNYCTYEAETAKLSPQEWAELQALPDTERKLREKQLVADDRIIQERIWVVNMQSAAPNYPNGPFMWPERVGPKKLKEIEEDVNRGPAVLAAQYLMNPIVIGTGLVGGKDEIIWTPRRILNELYARLTLFVAVDLAGMEETKKNSDNDYTAITLGGIGTDGHVYILECIHGRPDVDKVIDHLYDLHSRHPRIVQIKIEKEAHGRMLSKTLKAEEGRGRGYLPWMLLQRDNQTSKKQKIAGLQPWFNRGMIHFADDLTCRMQLITEITRFPKYKHDDILDTVNDLMASRDGGVQSEVMGKAKDEYEGNGSLFQPPIFPWMRDEFENESQCDSQTGW